MKRIIRFFSLLTVLSAMFSGCSLYRPQAVDLPLLENKGDLKVAIGSGNLSAAYAVTDNIGAQLYLKSLLDSMYMAQLSAGWYHPFENGTVAEVFGGLGYTGGITTTTADTNGARHQDGTIVTLFAQGDYGVVHRGFKGNMDFGVSLKTGLMAFDVNEYGWDPLDDEQTSDVTRFKGSSFFIEPGVMWRFGWEYVKFHLSFAWSLAPGADFYYTPWKVSAGINLSFNLLRP